MTSPVSTSASIGTAPPLLGAGRSGCDPGYNGCVCDVATCTFSPFCNDGVTMVWCNEAVETWTNCDSQCVMDGHLKGVCNFETGACQCG